MGVVRQDVLVLVTSVGMSLAGWAIPADSGRGNMASSTKPLAPPPPPPSLGLVSDNPPANIMDDAEDRDVNGLGLSDADVNMDDMEGEEVEPPKSGNHRTLDLLDHGKF
ncbi:hypothetical protein E2C01_029900 [Portunus trituberculatus]|uniref:Uncharacterized protein n=1 Tax=Portunus trituberculatus TaxID=210409 RepID=A0A5B7EQK1_PORTR|nr:hypothetical protein [Portunus trituberculatus]